MSHPTVHPMDLAPGLEAENDVPVGVRMRDIPGMPGTPSSLIVRLFQFVVSIASIGVMASTGDFQNAAAFSYLVIAVGLQSFWSLSLSIAHIYAILVGRRMRNFRMARLFAMGDEIFATLSFSAASASAAITGHMRADLHNCTRIHCGRFDLAVALAFISWFPLLILFRVNYWTAVTINKRR